MIGWLVKWLLLIPLAIILIAFAVANRHEVILRFDPIDVQDPAFALGLPVFAVVFGALAIGVVVGWTAAWINAGRARRAARTSASEAEKWKAEAEKLTPEPPADRKNALSLPLPKPSKAA
ncbi:MAG: hypothetical protein AAFX39_13685 [Pseudomonadota bacterium]